MLIIYITGAINIPRRNIRQAKKINNSLSSFQNKIRQQNPKNITLNWFIKLSYSLIEKF